MGLPAPATTEPQGSKARLNLAAIVIAAAIVVTVVLTTLANQR